LNSGNIPGCPRRGLRANRKPPFALTIEDSPSKSFTLIVLYTYVEGKRGRIGVSMGNQNVYDRLEPLIYRRIADAVAAALPVLDIACGDGRLIEFIASGTGRHIYGIDISLSNLIMARKKMEVQGISNRVLLVAGDARQLCFRDKSFGSLIMLYSLHEIRYLSQALEEARRVLQCGGKLIVVDPVKGGEAERLWNEPFYSLEEIKSMVTYAGFREMTSDFLYDDIVFLSASNF